MKKIKKIKIIFNILLCTSILFLFTNCDYSIVFDRYEFGQFPRLIYIVNLDTDLDFYGATIISINRGGTIQDNYPFPTEPVEWLTIVHSIDFTVLDIYPVEVIIRRTYEIYFSIHFYVEVISN